MKHSRIILSLSLIMTFMSGCVLRDINKPKRTFRMGFQNSAPRFDDFDLFLKTLSMWAITGDAADAAIVSTEVPWKELLAGQNPVDYVNTTYRGLVDYYRQNNLKVWVYIDPANGLNRTTDSQPLKDAGKSIADADAQKIYRRFVVVMDSLLKPDHLGLALETNLIRLAAPASIYNGVKKATNDVAAELQSRNSTAILSVSVQADVAWGSLQLTYEYTGIAQDLADFPFMRAMGISSYPYFGYTDPSDIPNDYYSRLSDEAHLPVFVTEGGWTSAVIIGPNGNTINGSPAKQANYIVKQEELLYRANAIAMFSLAFTDIDLSALPDGVDPSVKWFADLGMVDKDLKPKPAFDEWKRVFATRLDEIN